MTVLLRCSNNQACYKFRHPKNRSSTVVMKMGKLKAAFHQNDPQQTSLANSIPCCVLQYPSTVQAQSTDARMSDSNKQPMYVGSWLRRSVGRGCRHTGAASPEQHFFPSLRLPERSLSFFPTTFSPASAFQIMDILN